MTPEDIVSICAKLFPRAISDAGSAGAWLQTYRTTLGHLSGARLEAAWQACISDWEKTSPPMPKHILAHVQGTWSPSKAVYSNKTMRGLADALPAMKAEIIAEWWRANGAWLEMEMDNRGIPADDREYYRQRWKIVIDASADLHAQTRYWKDDAAGDFVADDYHMNRINPWGKKPAGISTRLGAIASRTADDATKVGCPING